MRGSYQAGTWQHDPTIYAPPKYRRACRYAAFLPDPIVGFDERIPADVAGLVSEAEAAVRSLNDQARPALRPLARLLLRTESIASSKVEGLQVDGRQLARAESRAEAGGKRPGPVVEEILANIDAMELAVQETSAVEALAPDHLVQIHRALLDHPATAWIAGRVRTEQNWIGGNDHNPCGAAFVPPPPELVRPLLEDLCTFCNDEVLPPLVQAAIAHAQFETIHPFVDGNGRTGRALVQVILRRRGLAPSYVPPLSVVLAGRKDRYIAGLTLFREDDDASRWIEQFAVATATSAVLARTYLSKVEDLQEGWRAAVRRTSSQRSDAAVWAIIDALPGHPVLSASVAATATGRSRSSIAVAIDVLVAAEVLVPVSTSRRNRAWEAQGILDLLGDLEAGVGS